MDFAHYYRELFHSFGYPLGRGASLAESTIDRAALSLDVTPPAALRDYYLVAGREKRFNRCFNRLIAPKDWRVSKNRLIFMEENQWVVWWGVSLRNPDNVDPPVSQAVNDDEDLDWYQENRKCSAFIAVMLHIQAVSGGFSHYGVADNVNLNELKKRLRGWTCYGKVNTTTAYSRQNQVVCIDTGLGVSVAAKTKADLKNIQNDLGTGDLS